MQLDQRDLEILRVLSTEGRITKAALADRLASGSPEMGTEAYEKLSAQATHNEALLHSAQRGIQAALSQLKAISSGEHQSTYTRAGERKPLSRPVSVTQKY